MLFGSKVNIKISETRCANPDNGSRGVTRVRFNQFLVFSVNSFPFPVRCSMFSILLPIFLSKVEML